MKYGLIENQIIPSGISITLNGGGNICLFHEKNYSLFSESLILFNVFNNQLPFFCFIYMFITVCSSPLYNWWKIDIQSKIYIKTIFKTYITLLKNYVITILNEMWVRIWYFLFLYLLIYTYYVYEYDIKREVQ